MARILENVDEIALSHAPHAVGCGWPYRCLIQIREMLFQEKVVFTVDLRSPELAVIDDMEQRLMSRC
jgi:N-carbamoyl-L-amino-acid hydrolase